MLGKVNGHNAKTNRSTSSHRLALLAAASIAGLLSLTSGPAYAGCDDTWNTGGNGNWFGSGGWSGGDPNGGGTNVCITNGTSTVDLNGNATIGDLAIGTGNTLDFDLGTTLTVDGSSIDNSGNILITGGTGNNSILGLNNNVDLSGGGTLTLAYTGTGGGTAIIQQQSGGLTLTNDETIEGTGLIGNGGLALVNNGTIDATGGLTLNGSGGVTNTNLLEATGGGTLQISTGVTNTGGTITAANGSTVGIDNTILNGTLTTLGNGILETSGGTATLNGVTISANSTYTASNGLTTDLVNTITNKGEISATGGSGNNAVIGLNNSVDLTGGGTVQLAYTGSGGGAAIIEQQTGGLTLTNDETIEGAGTIGNGGLALVNNDTVDANSSGMALFLNGSGGVTNTKLLEATGGGTLQISTTVDNFGGNIDADAGTVSISSTIQGGALNQSSGGFLETGGTATLDGRSTVEGAVTITGTYAGGTGTTTNILGTIDNLGTIQMTGGTGNNAVLGLNNSVDLTGGGTVQLAYTGSGNGGAIIQQNSGGFTLTNGETIEGSGTIGNGGLALINNDLIDANDTTGRELVLNGSGNVTNNANLQADDGGVLIINNTVQNGSGNILANAGSTVGFLNATINGGILGGTGTLETISGATLNGVTISANSTYTATNGTSTNLLNTIINKGEISATGGSGNNAVIGLNNSVDLTGGGTVQLAYTGSGNGGAIIQQNSGGFTLTNGETIEGSGTIGNGGLALINNDLIDANDTTGRELVLNGSGNVTNNANLQADDGGVLIINNTVQNGSGNILANAGSTVGFLNATINGGILGGTGTLETISGATLNGVTISANSTYTATNGTSTNLLNTIINKGEISATGGSGNNAVIGLNNSVDLTGGGTVQLAYTGSGNGGAIIQQNSGGFTLTNGETIEGSGTIGNGGLALINNDLIDANDTTGRELVLNGSGNVTNNANLQADDGGVLIINNTVQNGSGNILANAGSTVGFLNATINGGILGGTGTLETISGATLNGVTISANSTYTATNGTSTNLLNTIINKGEISATGGSGNNAVIGLNNSVDLTGGGTVQLAYTGLGNGVAIIQQNSGGFTLTNENNTIEGTGIIGNSGLSLTNNGTVFANSFGHALVINGSGTITNNGTFEAAAGSELQVTNGAFTNFAGGTLTGGTYNIYGTAANAGTMQINELGNTGGEIVNNDATIYLNGVNSNLVDAAGKDALFNFDNNESGGSFTITNGRNFTAPGAFANAGNVTVGTNSTFSAGNSESGLANYDQSAGNTLVDGTLEAANVNVNGGELQGTGTLGANSVETDLFNYGGTVRPGDPGSTGTLRVDGNFTQAAGGTLEIDIAGISQNSQLDVSGHTSLAGTLAVELLSGFHFATGETFDIVNTDPFSGDFNAFSLDGVACTSGGTDIWDCSNLGNGLYLTEEFLNGGDQLWLQVNGQVTNPVPEPGSLFLFGSALCALGAEMLRRRRRTARGVAI